MNEDFFCRKCSFWRPEHFDKGGVSKVEFRFPAQSTGRRKDDNDDDSEDDTHNDDSDNANKKLLWGVRTAVPHRDHTTKKKDAKQLWNGRNTVWKWFENGSKTVSEFFKFRILLSKNHNWSSTIFKFGTDDEDSSDFDDFGTISIGTKNIKICCILMMDRRPSNTWPSGAFVIRRLKDRLNLP